MNIIWWSVVAIYGVSMLAGGALGLGAAFSPRVRAHLVG